MGILGLVISHRTTVNGLRVRLPDERLHRRFLKRMEGAPIHISSRVIQGNRLVLEVVSTDDVDWSTIIQRCRELDIYEAEEAQIHVSAAELAMVQGTLLERRLH